MPLFDSFQSGAAQVIKLSRMSSIPTTEDLKYALAESKRHNKPVELPFENNRCLFIIRVVQIGNKSPHWTFQRGEGPQARVVWTRESTEVMMIQNKVKVESSYETGTQMPAYNPEDGYEEAEDPNAQDGYGQQPGSNQGDLAQQQQMYGQSGSYAQAYLQQAGSYDSASFQLAADEQAALQDSGRYQQAAASPAAQANPFAPGGNQGASAQGSKILLAPKNFIGFGAAPQAAEEPAQMQPQTQPGFGAPPPAAMQAQDQAQQRFNNPNALAPPPATSQFQGQIQPGGDPNVLSAPPSPMQFQEQGDPNVFGTSPSAVPFQGQGDPNVYGAPSPQLQAQLQAQPPAPMAPAVTPPKALPPRPSSGSTSGSEMQAPIPQPAFPPPHPAAAPPPPPPQIQSLPPLPSFNAAGISSPVLQPEPVKLELPPPYEFDPNVLPVFLDKCTDLSTGLASFDAFAFFIHRAFIRWEQRGTSFAVVILELTIHHEGQIYSLPTDALGIVADRIHYISNPLDISSRLPEGEFITLLSDCDGELAFQFAEQVYSAMVSTPLLSDLHAASIEASINAAVGVAALPESCDDLGVLIAAARTAKELAKSNNPPCMLYPRH